MPVGCWMLLALVSVSVRLSAAITPPEKCYPIADVIFLIDGSDSMSDEEFQNQKTFIRRFVQMSKISPDEIRVGYAVVSSRIGSTLNLTTGSVKTGLVEKIERLTQPQEGSRTDRGIMFIDNMFFTQGRQGTVYIGVILTDGRAKYKKATEAEAALAKNSGVYLITIGVGRNIQDDLLKRIASTPGNSYHLQPMNYSLTLLMETVKYLGKEWCSDLVAGLTGSSEKRKQGISFGFGPGFSNNSVSNKFSANAADKIKTNRSLTDYSLKPLQLFHIKRAKEKATTQPEAKLPQTTVFPVTKNNLGRILQALVSSKRAKSQGIAFVKSRKDLKDALRILLISRALSLKKLYQNGNGTVQSNTTTTTSTVTAMPLPHVQPTITSTLKIPTVDPNIGRKKTVLMNKTPSQITEALISAQKQFRSQLANLSMFSKRTQSGGALKSNRFPARTGVFTESPHSKAVSGHTLKPSAVNFEEETLMGVFDKPDLTIYKSPEQVTSHISDHQTSLHKGGINVNRVGAIDFEKERLLGIIAKPATTDNKSIEQVTTPLSKTQTSLHKRGKNVVTKDALSYGKEMSLDIMNKPPTTKRVNTEHVTETTTSLDIGGNTENTVGAMNFEKEMLVGVIDKPATTDNKTTEQVTTLLSDINTVLHKKGKNVSTVDAINFEKEMLLNIIDKPVLTDNKSTSHLPVTQTLLHKRGKNENTVGAIDFEKEMSLGIIDKQAPTKIKNTEHVTRHLYEAQTSLHKTGKSENTVGAMNFEGEMLLGIIDKPIPMENKSTKQVSARMSETQRPLNKKVKHENTVGAMNFETEMLLSIIDKQAPTYNKSIRNVTTQLVSNETSLLKKGKTKYTVGNKPQRNIMPEDHQTLVTQAFSGLLLKSPLAHAGLLNTNRVMSSVSPFKSHLSISAPQTKHAAELLESKDAVNVSQNVINKLKPDAVTQDVLKNSAKNTSDKQAVNSQSRIAFLEGLSHVKPFQWSRYPVMDFSKDVSKAFLQLKDRSHTKIQDTNSKKKPDVARTKFPDPGGQSVALKHINIKESAVGNRRSPLSPVSMFSGPGRMAFSIFKGLSPKRSIIRKRPNDTKRSEKHTSDIQAETASRKFTSDRDNGKKESSKLSKNSESPAISHSQSTGLNRRVFEVDSFVTIERVSNRKQVGKADVQSRKFGFSSPSFRSKIALSNFKTNLSDLTKQISKETLPNRTSALQQAQISTPDSLSDNGNHSREIIRQNVEIGAFQGNQRHDHTDTLIIQHPKHNHTLDKTVALQLCMKSQYVDGIGYTYKPNSCTDFLQCIHDDGHIKVEVGHCPIGTYFDEKSVVCRPHNIGYCTRDPCSGQKANTFGHPSNCRGYWQCEAGRSKPGCCPYGFSYSSDGNCVMDTNCTRPCLETTPNCNSSEFKTNDRFYFENFPGFGWVIRTCPNQSRYVAEACKCQPWEENEARVECNPHVSLDFEDNQFDSNKALHNRNVKIEGGVGKFEGRAMITLWRFTGVSFGTSVLITMRFKIPDPEKLNGKLMHLLSNCCLGCRGRPGPTIDIAVLADSSGGVVVLSTYSSTSGEKFVFIPYKNSPSGWNSLTYSYDGQWLVGTVNDVTARQQMKGTIESRPYPLLLGSCGTVPSFQGYIDDFKIYLCKP